MTSELFIYDNLIREHLKDLQKKIQEQVKNQKLYAQSNNVTGQAIAEAKLECYRDAFDSLSKIVFEKIPSEIQYSLYIQSFLKNPRRAQA